MNTKKEFNTLQKRINEIAHKRLMQDIKKFLSGIRTQMSL